MTLHVFEFIATQTHYSITYLASPQLQPQSINSSSKSLALTLYNPVFGFSSHFYSLRCPPHATSAIQGQKLTQPTLCLINHCVSTVSRPLNLSQILSNFPLEISANFLNSSLQQVLSINNACFTLIILSLKHTAFITSRPFQLPDSLLELFCNPQLMSYLTMTIEKHSETSRNLFCSIILHSSTSAGHVFSVTIPLEDLLIDKDISNFFSHSLAIQTMPYGFTLALPPSFQYHRKYDCIELLIIASTQD
ncbi:hypothetical protein O181_053925 [Austropuccinia psidii MF-1]|uniref:Uncharacterized protein n=1 Tax=Austropuccinia psidii MF-1 TaxID=1389203 RepID=A0A9Q3HTX3_9BASI|nr:hypothetical protein [Austropuccinia psidii MF-1]